MCNAGSFLKARRPNRTGSRFLVLKDSSGFQAYGKNFAQLGLPRLRTNALIVFDNMLQNGRVIDPKDESAQAIDSLSKKLRADPRVECVLLAVADGLMFCRKV